MLFQIFRLSFSRDILKCSILVTNFQKLPSPQRLLIFNIGDLKFRDLAK